jgi:histidinol-phosphatase (PHP family)
MKNYHTHTFRCKHATGNVSDYAVSAIEKGLTHLGFSDHTPLPDNRWPEVRMHLSELSSYVREIEEAQNTYREINIFKGAECEFLREYLNFYSDELLGKHGFQYLIGGAHYFPLKGEWINCYQAENSKEHLIAYTDYLIKSIDCDLFAFIAHPDLFANFYLQWDDEARACSKAILEAASDKKRVLEINGYGYRKAKIQTPSEFRKPYPEDHFWEMATAYNMGVTINSDAHKPEDIDNFGGAMELIEKNDLNLIDLDF